MSDSSSVTRSATADALLRLAGDGDAAGDYDGCPMCELIAESDSLDSIAQSEHAIAILAPRGARVGHIWVLAKDHVDNTVELGWPAYSDLQHVVFDAHRAIEKALAPRRIYTATLHGPHIPSSCAHYHTHVVPIYEMHSGARPSQVFSIDGGTIRYSMEEAAALSLRLRRAWPRRF